MGARKGKLAADGSAGLSDYNGLASATGFFMGAASDLTPHKEPFLGGFGAQKSPSEG
jgi:hypothetical protein